MKAFEMMKKQKSGMPAKPYIGQLYYEPYTKTMRVWSGKLWLETNSKEMAEKIKQYGSLSKWMEKEHGYK